MGKCISSQHYAEEATTPNTDEGLEIPYSSNPTTHKQSQSQQPSNILSKTNKLNNTKQNPKQKEEEEDNEIENTTEKIKLIDLGSSSTPVSSTSTSPSITDACASVNSIHSAHSDSELTNPNSEGKNRLRSQTMSRSQSQLANIYNHGSIRELNGQHSIKSIRTPNANTPTITSPNANITSNPIDNHHIPSHHIHHSTHKHHTHHAHSHSAHNLCTNSHQHHKCRRKHHRTHHSHRSHRSHHSHYSHHSHRGHHNRRSRHHREYNREHSREHSREDSYSYSYSNSNSASESYSSSRTDSHPSQFQIDKQQQEQQQQTQPSLSPTPGNECVSGNGYYPKQHKSHKSLQKQQKQQKRIKRKHNFLNKPRLGVRAYSVSRSEFSRSEISRSFDQSISHSDATTDDEEIIIQTEDNNIDGKTNNKKYDNNEDNYFDDEDDLFHKKEKENVKLLFLDVDGVLNGANCNYAGIDNARVSLLKQIVDLTNCKIILSTTWRLNIVSRNTLIAILQMIGDINADEIIIGDTPCKTKLQGNETLKRIVEINAFLNNKKFIKKYNVLSWVAIDDMPLLNCCKYKNKPKNTKIKNNFMEGHFVRTDCKTGLIQHDVFQVVSMLNGYDQPYTNSYDY